MKEIMIDIETLGVTPDSVILSVGAVTFDSFADAEPNNGKLWKLEFNSQEAAGRCVDENTLKWWARQSPEIIEDGFSDSNRISVQEFCKELNKYTVGVQRIWCQGPQFDMVIIENLYKQFNHHVNWQFWQIMDSRTLFNMMPVDPRKAIQTDLHNALADAYFQAVCVQQAVKHFEMKPRTKK